MLIDTDDYVSLPEACKITGIKQSTGYRLAKHLGIAIDLFGTKIVRKADLETMKKNRKPLGNPRWIESPEQAAEAALKAVASREKRKKAEAKAALARAAASGTTDAPAAGSPKRRSRRAPSQ